MSPWTENSRLRRSETNPGRPYDRMGMLWLRQGSEKNGHGHLQDQPGEIPDEAPPDEDEAILCRQCLKPVTHPNHRISIQGAHRHTFANPHGLVFEIGCFDQAPGCGVVGPATNEFTWFKGYVWRVAVCRWCLAHLGWYFSAAGEHYFYGLILNHLIQTRGKA